MEFVFPSEYKQAGLLKKYKNLEYVINRGNYYILNKYNIVILKIVGVSLDYYKLENNYILPNLEFINATKRNRPMLSKGDIILGYIKHDNLVSCKAYYMGKIDECFYIGVYRSKFVTFNKQIKGRFCCSANGYIWIDGDTKTKKSLLDKINKI